MSSDTNASLNLALLGAGRWAKAYVRTIDAMPGLRLNWIARSRDEAPEFLPAGCRFTTDWKFAVGDPGTHGVIVATPPQAHAEMASFAMRSGKPVLIEKPLTLDLREAAALVVEARQQRAIAMVEHTHLFNPSFRALKKQLPLIGSIDGIHAVAGNWGPFRRSVPILWDWGAHDIAMYLDLFGIVPDRVDAVRTASEPQPDGSGEAFRIDFQAPNGAPVRMEFGNLFEKKTRRFIVYGSKASLVFDDMAEAKLQICSPATPFEPPESGTALEAEASLPLTVAVREFASAIRAGAPGWSHLQRGADVVRFLALCQRSLDGHA
jgi:predicted dehydrogenase